jgi:outer membrane protein OmpA-like peptidoglycan-associated protein
MMKKFILFPVLVFLCLPFTFLSQDDDEKGGFCHEVTDKKAISYYKKGIDKKKYNVKKERMEFLSKAIELDSEFVEAQFALAQEMLVLWKLEKMQFGPIKPLLKNILRLCPNIHADPLYYIGYDYYESGRSDSAKKYLERFLNFQDNDEKKYPKDYEQMVYNTKLMLAQLKIDMAKEGKKVPFDPKVVLPISTQFDEFLCYVTPDDSIFYFTQRAPFVNKNMAHETDEWQETFMYSKRKSDGSWSVPEAMYYPFNKNSHEGGPTLTINNKRLYYTVFVNEGGGFNADIFYSDFFDGEWLKPQKVPNINDPNAWDSQPSISPDGNTLFFASDREGGLGGIDIYIARRDPATGIFSKPLNMGPIINTKLKEKCPFIHSDGETLYFCSDGRVDGYGGLDIYLSRLDEKTLTFKTPENIGYPINSPEDDAGIVVSTDGKYGYFAAEPSANLRGGVGKFDIYRFDLHPDAKPFEVTFLRGDVKDNNGATVKGAKVEIKNTGGTHKIDAVVDSMSGDYVAAVNKKNFKTQVVITAKKEDYAFSAVVVDVSDKTFASPAPNASLEMKELKVNERIVINDIHYKTNSAELDPRSDIMLNEFAQWLKENPKIRVEIGGHTDNVGSSSTNLALSTDRAFTVKAYLEDRGIDGHRITAKGYGDSMPIADNKTADGKAQNRRTEFKVLAK